MDEWREELRTLNFLFFDLVLFFNSFNIIIKKKKKK